MNTIYSACNNLYFENEIAIETKILIEFSK